MEHQAIKNMRRPVQIYGALTAGASVAIACIGLLLGLVPLERSIRNMGTQVLLDTIPVALWVIYLLGMLFWRVGLMSAALQSGRGQEPEKATLFDGFHRMGPVLVVWIWRVIQCMLTGWIGYWLVGILISMLPMPAAAADIWLNFVESFTVPADAEGRIVLGMYVVCYATGILVMALPVFFRYRLAEYEILDDPEMGGMLAMQNSRLMLRRGWLRLLRLDLRFWWYYLLEAALLAASVLPVLMLLGVAMPVPEMAVWGISAAAAIGRFGLHILAKPRVSLAYGMLFEKLSHQEPEEAKPKPKPEKMPWKY